MEVMGTMGCYQGHGLPVTGVLGALLTLQRQHQSGQSWPLGLGHSQDLLVGPWTVPRGAWMVTSVMQLLSSAVHMLPVQRLIREQGA